MEAFPYPPPSDAPSRGYRLPKADLLTNIISSGRDAATNKETASLLAKHYENKSKLTFNANDWKLLRTYRKAIQDSKRYNHKNIFTIPLVKKLIF
ncbi:hypothetical protein TNCV_1578131 [Trichonephila clavipes]|nr:hypothetical protein TNCV_1578131 [Trichonephila clavipes]